MRRRMGHPAGLARLALATRDEPIPPAVRPISDTIAAVPKLRCDSIIDDIANHLCSLSVLDQPKCVAAELEVVPSLIDAEGPVPFDVQTMFHVGEQIVESGGTRLKAD